MILVYDRRADLWDRYSFATGNLYYFGTFVLEAVGTDWDGTVKPISELREGK